MNHHAQQGPQGHHHIQPAVPLPPHRREQYHTYHHPPQSPAPPNFYGANYHAPFYGHPQQPQYRWQPQYPQQHFVPLPHMQQQQQQQQQFQPRSPMVVSSQPHHPQTGTPVTRHQNPMAPPPPQATQSPRPIHSYVQQPVPAAPPSPAPSSPLKVEEHQSTATPPPPPQPEPTRRPSTAQNPLSLPPEHKDPFWPKLPWYSTPDGSSAFPARATPRRRRRQHLRSPSNAVALPTREERVEDEKVEPSESQTASAEDPPSEVSTIAAPSEPETPATSQAPSESDYTHVSTPATPAQPISESPKPTPTQQHARRDTRTAIAIPHIPGLPKEKDVSPSATAKLDSSRKAAEENISKSNGDVQKSEASDRSTEVEDTAPKELTPAPVPKSWADMVRRNAKPQAPSSVSNGEIIANGFALPKSASLADALRQYSVHNDNTVPFLEPRGLVNTGNMCYMNSILQVLVFCVPFFNFLDQVRQRTIHSMKSETPLVDAMIMFMREFKVLESAHSVIDLRAKLNQQQLEMYGSPITPEYVYEVIRTLPRFAGMRRGHQQDAEEFLGFLLEGLHDECVKVIQGQGDSNTIENGTASSETVTSPSADGWLEVGPKQKAAITRTAGEQEAPSPVTKIFGGQLRSELKVTGVKDSVTLEPYKPLQLDIGAENVNNIVDALKGLTRVEQLTGDFGGRNNNGAKKQVFIDTLPPILILHLKRFQYDSSSSKTQKIWKKVGYPLELEIPKEVFSPAKRGGLAVHGGAPKYRLTSVVYHHGKSAAGGHYTVDVLRQDSREWIRMDDTIIRRIRPEDVAEGGSEEDPKVLAKALEQHKADQDMQKQRNIYQGLDEAETESTEEKPWSEVNGHASGHTKKRSGAAIATNGTETPSNTSGKRTPTSRKEGIRDNKVAYILLYERIRD